MVSKRQVLQLFRKIQEVSRKATGIENGEIQFVIRVNANNCACDFFERMECGDLK